MDSLPAFLIVFLGILFATAMVIALALLAWLATRGRGDAPLAARVAELEDTVRRLEARFDGLERRHGKPIDPDATHVEPAP